MKNMMSIVFILSSLLFSVNSAAASGHSTGKVTTLLWYEGHIGLLIKQEGMSDLGGCGRSDYYILDDQHPYFKENLLINSLCPSRITTIRNSCRWLCSRHLENKTCE